MSRILKNQRYQQNLSALIEVKSKFDAEFRRFSVERSNSLTLREFTSLLEELHHLSNVPFVIAYTDPRDGDLLPLTNDDNFRKALECTRTTLRLIIQRKGVSYDQVPNGSGHRLPSILSPFVQQGKNKISISYPQDFRQVAAIIDVDLVPDVCRRVRLLKHGSDKPLGFYIRDGTSVRVTSNGLERVPGIFISRLVPGGLAESTGLLAVNDEVIEVNSIDVNGKTLDQVTDMMVANSSNLIITVKPANQRTLTHFPGRGSFSRTSAISSTSQPSQHSAQSDEETFEADEIRDMTGEPPSFGEGGRDSKDEGILHL